MMRILSIVTLLLVTMAGVTSAQGWNDTMQWEDKPAYLAIDAGHETENAVGIFYNEKIEYLYMFPLQQLIGELIMMFLT